jgi:putative chitinase
MNITKEILMNGTACTSGVADVWLPFIQAACDKYNVNTVNRIAAFLANVGVESTSLTRFEENLHYSAAELAKVWPTRYAVKNLAELKTPNELAIKLAAAGPEAIANNVYASRMGNGDEQSGDGWTYRGQGPIQITGKSNILRCLAAIGLTSEPPDLLQKPKAGALSAAWFFSSNKCNELADAGKISEIVKNINGEIPCVANQGTLRINRFRSTAAMFK